jgi:hypothetical protein
MRSSKDIEKIVRDGKLNVKTSNQMDKLTLDGSYSVMDETVYAKSPNSKFSILTLLVRNKIAVGTVTAIIILAIGLFVFQPESNSNFDIPKVTSVTQSPAEMLTLRALKAAYYNGGIEAVETQCDNAIKKLKLKSNKITINELLADINGT